MPLFRHAVTNESPEVLSEDMKEKFDNYTSKVTLMKLAVLSHPTKFVHIYSKGVLESIYQKYIGKDSKEKNVIEINKEIFEKFIEGFDIDVSSGGEDDICKIVQLSKFLWGLENPDFKQFADKASPNMIFYGAPGTGKTYTVKKNIEYLCGGNSSRYEYVQFHPSFTYEDFIDGIKPNGIDDKGGVKLELVNGIFKEFCIRAKKDPDNNYYFIVDEINRANLSAVFGETLSLLESSYRHKVSKNSDDNAEAIGENLISTQYSALLDSLLKKDEKDKEEKYKHLVYEIREDDEGNKHSKFGVPDNVFFIGMMNDVDKSIDAFDLALRRRFKWIHKGYDEKILINHCKHNDKDFSNIEEYAKCASALNKYIAKDLGLGLSYEFGHSFFMKISSVANEQDITEKNPGSLFELYLRPMLKEYLRAFYSEDEIGEKLKEALEVFKKPLVNKSSKGADQSETNSSD
ncbi:McrB family protein [Moraxella bovoculi]|uniref:McrB family protein n=1 Tax=Moraxella bovoculi TaxID=386891 RepID=UPI0012D42C06|nr:AAA family ATPase [Moraxella bovoculi]